MLQSRQGRFRPSGRADFVETAVIVALAALVLIKGGGAVAGVFLGIGRMMAAVVSALTY